MPLEIQTDIDGSAAGNTSNATIDLRGYPKFSFALTATGESTTAVYRAQLRVGGGPWADVSGTDVTGTGHQLGIDCAGATEGRVVVETAQSGATCAVWLYAEHTFRSDLN